MRVVMDTNVLVSTLISEKGAPGRLLALWQEEKFDLIISPEIIQELERVLHYPKLQRRHRLSDRGIQEFLRLLRRQATEVTPTSSLTIIARDAEDDRYLECALAGDADAIVSGDQHLLELGQHQGIQILTPAGFLALLKLEG